METIDILIILVFSIVLISSFFLGWILGKSYKRVINNEDILREALERAKEKEKCNIVDIKTLNRKLEDSEIKASPKKFKHQNQNYTAIFNKTKLMWEVYNDDRRMEKPKRPRTRATLVFQDRLYDETI